MNHSNQAKVPDKTLSHTRCQGRGYGDNDTYSRLKSPKTGYKAVDVQ